MRVKGATTSCASHSSTAIYSSSNPAGGRPIGRHIPDEKRVVETPATRETSIDLNKMKTSHHDGETRVLKKNPSKPLDLTAVKGGRGRGCLASKVGVDYFSPHRSSRYLLRDNDGPESGFLDGSSDIEPGLKIKASPASHEGAKVKSDHQVVVLRVSLHCRGCEGKVRKHISRTQGVTSFSIDFFAKRVTIVGDVTPLEVLAAVSKAKKAQLWPPSSTSVGPIAKALSNETTYSAL